MKPIKMPRPAPTATIVSALSQPLFGPSMIPNSKRANPAIDSRAPTKSSLCFCGSREVGTRKKAPANASRITGTLIRKIEPHQNLPSNSPDATGPIDAPAPAKPAQRATALVRSLSSAKTFVMIDKVAGITKAAPTPMMAAMTRSNAPETSRSRPAATRRRRCHRGAGRPGKDFAAIEKRKVASVLAYSISQCSGIIYSAWRESGVSADTFSNRQAFPAPGEAESEHFRLR